MYTVHCWEGVPFFWSVRVFTLANSAWYVVTYLCVLAAAKAAVQRFTQSREAMQREKDLLKSVKVRP